MLHCLETLQQTVDNHDHLHHKKDKLYKWSVRIPRKKSIFSEILMLSKLFNV